MSCEKHIPVGYSETWGKPIKLKNLSSNDYVDFTGCVVNLNVTDEYYKAITNIDGDVSVDGQSISFTLDDDFWAAFGTKSKINKDVAKYPCSITYTLAGVIKTIPGLTFKILL